jgi:LPS sulfotransferase NodH
VASERPGTPRTVPDVDSYLICATPRCGSTLLCGLLRSTGIASRPESYFRRDDLCDYADRWEVPQAADGVVDTTYVRAAVAAGRTTNGVFGARIMWGTMTELTDALRYAADGSTASDVELLTGAFGRLRFVHLRRDDTVAQAVSWARAEQTQFWHPGDRVAPGGQPPHFDRDLIGGLVDTITRHEAAWQAWFTHRGLVPHEVVYEDLATDPSDVTRTVLEFLGLDPSAGAPITVRNRRQADDLNADWISRFHA